MTGNRKMIYCFLICYGAFFLNYTNHFSDSVTAQLVGAISLAFITGNVVSKFSPNPNPPGT